MFSSCPNSPRQVIGADAALLILVYISSIYDFKPNCIPGTEKVPQQKAKKPHILFSWSFMVVNPFCYFRIATLQQFPLSHTFPSMPFLCLCSLISYPHFFQPFSLSLNICDPFPYHHQPFGRSALPPQSSSCFPDTISHASCPATLTLQSLLLTPEPSKQAH